MSDLIQTVTDGIIQQTKNTTKEASGNELGKDAFLQLLTTQMKYQDPLQPNTDTEFISQLATFSQLEQMQNLGAVTTNSQAFSLVGKSVIVKSENQTGNATFISGKVDFVNMAAGKAQISIDGNLYSIDKLDSVIDDTYITEQGLPGIATKTKLSYDAQNPKNLTFDVDLGDGETVADDVAILINGALIDASLISVSGKKVTVDKSAFTAYENGTYKATIAFNDSLFTTVKDMVTLEVKNVAAEDTGSADTTTDTSTTGA